MTEIEQEMRALLACSSPVHRNVPRSIQGLTVPRSDGPTPRRRLCLETSFTSLQSPLTDNYPQIGRELSVDSRGLPWEYVSLASEILGSPIRPAEILKATCRPPDWSRQAPLATPETLSEASSSPPSPLPGCHRPMMRRTPKITGNLSTAADDLKNNLHFAMLSAKNYYLRGELHGSAVGSTVSSSSNSNSAVNSEASYGSAKSLAQGPPPPVPRRRDSVLVGREHRVCTAACCRDDLSENSSPQTSTRSFRVSHRVQIDFTEEENETNGSSLDFYEAKQVPTEPKDSSNDVFLSVRSSPECKGLMAPATDLGAEWKRNKLESAGPGCSGGADASLPLLRGLSPTPQASSPFFTAKRKKYVYPITLVGRGESSV